MIDDVIDHYGDLITQGNVCLFYSGYFSQPIITGMVTAFKVKLEHDGVQSAIRRRLMSSLVEVTQNMLHYAQDTLTPEDQDDHQLRWGMVSVTLSDGCYHIECANRVSDDQAARLAKRIDRLRLMNADEIRAEYAEALRSEPEEGSRGAGLGLITLARDAQAPLHYQLRPDPHRPGLQLFLLRAVI